MLDVDVPTVQHLSNYAENLPPKEFRVGRGSPGTIRVGLGDQLRVGIWESIPNGLFSTGTQKRTELALVVDDKGMIYVPYAGEIAVADRSISEVREQILNGLAGKAVDPQVVVNLEANGSHKVIVTGEIMRPGQYRVHEDGSVWLRPSLRQAEPGTPTMNRLSRLSAMIANSALVWMRFQSSLPTISGCVQRILSLSPINQNLSPCLEQLPHGANSTSQPRV